MEESPSPPVGSPIALACSPLSQPQEIEKYVHCCTIILCTYYMFNFSKYGRYCVRQIENPKS